MKFFDDIRSKLIQKGMSENEIYQKMCRSDLNKGQTPIQQIDTVYNWELN